MTTILLGTPDPEPDEPLCLNAALIYAKGGWPVFPCHPLGKAPLLAGHGHHDATIDEDVIEGWFLETPNANVAIACEAAGLLVLDIDSYHNDIDVEGWLNGRILPETYTVVTGNLGRQLYYLAPDGPAVPSSNSKVTKYVDIKARGAYVVAPPSRTTYTYVVIDDRDPVPAPEWLVEELRREPPRLEPPPPTSVPAVSIDVDFQSPYARKAMDEDGARLAAAPEGIRNDLLNKTAFRWGQLIAMGHVSRSLVEGRLRQCAAQASFNGDHPLTQTEIDNAVKLSVEAGMNNPGTTPQADVRLTSMPTQRSGNPTLKSVTLAKVEPRPADLLWDSRLVCGGFTLLGGNGGVGKSSLAMSIATSFATGEGLPAQSDADRGSTLVLSYEDPPEVLASRLKMNGFCPDQAPHGTIEFIDAAAPFEQTSRQLVPEDIELVCDRARSIDDLRLVILDPIMQFIGASTNPLLDNQIRAVLSKLKYLADELNVAVLVVAHTHKGMPAGYEHLAEWIAGSSGIKNYSRSALVALKEPRTRRKFLVHAKANWSAERPDLEFDTTGGVFRWCPPPATDLVRNLLSVPRLTEVDRACDFLRDLLKEAGGSLLKEIVVAEAEKQGIRPVTLDRAKAALDIDSDRTKECPSRAIWTLNQ